MPERRGLPPEYEQRAFSSDIFEDRLALIVSPQGRDDSVKIHQDVSIYGSRIAAGRELTYSLDPGRGVWLQIIKGNLSINGSLLRAGDGAAIQDERHLALQAQENSELLLLDLA